MNDIFPELGPAKRKLGRAEIRSGLSLSDEVTFHYKGEVMRGMIVKFNPKKAKVLCTDGRTWNVPYSLLRTKEGVVPEGETGRLMKVRRTAEALMLAYGLDGWVFTFDEAGRRGQCSYEKRRISLTTHHAAKDDPFDVIETILHEIAHALADQELKEKRRWETDHGPTWDRIARSIGGKYD